MSASDIELLINACFDGNYRAVLLLLRKGLAPTPKNDGEPSPLIISIEQGFFEISSLIIEFDDNIEYFDDTRNSAVLSALYEENMDLALLLMSKGGVLFDIEQKYELFKYFKKKALPNFLALVERIPVKRS